MRRGAEPAQSGKKDDPTALTALQICCKTCSSGINGAPGSSRARVACP